jgi:FtsP/CotA-like multicopper oxidase with cupredoxin domain
MRSYLSVSTFVAALVLTVLTLVATPSGIVSPAMAQGATNPCTEKLDYKVYGLKDFQNPKPIESVGATLTATLDIHYTDPATTKIGNCGLTLRSYNGGIVGPTLIVKPGDLMKITVKNNLLPINPKCKNSDGSAHEMDMMEPPEIYDVTNLHTHGLHVSPSNNPNGTHQDNVFVTICPGTTAEYEIHVPSNHPPGTFWYHAHVHGSTALQVSSTIEGAIIVKGGLDNVPQISAAPDQIFVLQQISYNQDGKIVDANEMYDDWERTGENTMVNGQFVPLIKMHQGEIQRWRMIHAGVDQSLYVRTTGGPLYEIATDGNALGRIDTWRANLELEPGYRSDVLFKAPMRPGRYYLLTGAVSAQKSLLFLAYPGALAKGDVKGTEAKYIVAINVDNVVHDMPLPTEAQLKPLAPYKPITRNELNGAPQTVEFAAENAICQGAGRCRPCTPKGDNDPDCTNKFMVDWYVFPNGPTRQLKLNTASSWTISIPHSSEAQAHPFHVHVNPFELVRLGPDGKDETVWKDTLMIREGAPLKYRVVLSRYEDYTGAFVLHCHILPHEDKGMMQTVEIVN